jgi:hypothetical protein
MDEFVHYPVQVLAALLAIVSPAFKAGRRFWMNLWARIRSKPLVPSETLRIVQDVQQSFWALGSFSGIPATQVVFEGHVTDISGATNRVLRVDIPKPLTHATMILLSDNHDTRRQQVLRAHECTGIHAMFFVQPVVGEKGKPWQTPLIFIDQYGNQHKIKNCVFRPIPPVDTAQPKET